MNVNRDLLIIKKLLLFSRSFFIYFVFSGFITFSGVSSLYAQTYSINAYIDGTSNETLFLCSQFGDYSKLLDTIVIDDRAGISYKIPDSYTKGLYRFYFDNDKYFDLVLNGEDISFTTTKYAPRYFMKIEKSEENTLLYSFFREQDIRNNKIEILSNVLESYPREDLFYKKAYKQFNKENKALNKYYLKLVKGKESLFSTRLIKYYTQLPLPFQKGEKEIQEFMISNYWEYYPLNDVELINSDAYTNAIVGYLKLFLSPKLKPKDLENQYKKACDGIMLHVSSNDAIYQFALKYLMEGFEQFEMFELVSYLAETYGDRCIDSDSDSSLSLRIKNFTDFVPGKMVPPINIVSVGGTEFKGFVSSYTLIVFWATWCGHCRKSIPELSNRLKELQLYDVEVIGISLDSNIDDLNLFVSENKISFPVLCDVKAWECPAAIDYAVYATPSMYLVDNNGVLLAKPIYVSEVFDFLKEIR